MRRPSEKKQALLETVQVCVARTSGVARCQRLMERHHYLGGVRPVGERMYYVACTPNGGEVAVRMFGASAQAGQLYRKIGKHQPETVWMLTSREPERLNAQQCLQAQRDYWRIEAGLHQSLDVSALEDLC